MHVPPSISPVIIESLYEEALALADEARASFDLSSHDDVFGEVESAARVALSCEALRTTTRMMHAIAWLLNHRAYFKGEMTEFQLRRYGRLPKPQADGTKAQMARLDLATLELVNRTKLFYGRLARLDRAWQESFAMQPPAVERLRHRIDSAFAMH